jgi:hypothetical protein
MQSARVNSSVISKDQLRDVRKLAETSNNGQAKESVIVTQQDAQRIKSSTIILSKDQVKEQRLIQKEKKDQQQIASRLRKERMIEMDKARASKVPKTDHEI